VARRLSRVVDQRRWWRLLAILLASGFILLAGALFWLQRQLGAGLLEQQLAAALSDFLGRRVTVGAITLGWTGGLTLDRIGVAGEKAEAPLFLLGQARADYSYWELLTGRLAIDSIRFVKPSLHLVRHSDGTFNFADILERLGRRKDLPSASTPAIPRRPQDVPELPLQKLSFENVDVRLEDRTVQPNVVRNLENLQLALEMPGPNLPLVIDLRGQMGRARATAHGELYVAPLVGRVEFTLKGLGVEGLEPYLARLKLPMTLQSPSLDLDAKGWLDVGADFLTFSESKPVLDPGAIRYGADLSLSRATARVAGTDIGLKLEASILTGSARLKEGSLWLNDRRVLTLSGSLDNFKNPSFDLAVNAIAIPVDRLLALIPRALLPGQALSFLDRVEPQGTLSGELHALGTPAKPLVSGFLSASGLAWVGPAFTVDLDARRLRFQPGQLGIEGLSVRAQGCRLDLDSEVREILAAPALTFKADLRIPDLAARNAPALASARSLALRLTGALDTRRLLAKNGCRTLVELAAKPRLKGFEPLLAFRTALQAETSRLASVTSTATAAAFLDLSPGLKPGQRVRWKALEALRDRLDLPRLVTLLTRQLPAAVAAARDLLQAKFALELGLKRVSPAFELLARHLPAGKFQPEDFTGAAASPAGTHELSLQGNVSLDLEAGLRTRDLRLDAGPVTVSLEVTADKLLELPRFRAAAALAPGTGAMPLATLLALAPAPIRTAAAEMQLSTDARVGAQAMTSFSAAGGHFSVELFAEGLAAGKPPHRLRLGPVRLSLSETGLRLARTRIDLGALALAAEAQLTREEGARLTLRSADAEGIDLLALLASGPHAESRALLAPVLAGGRAGFSLAATASSPTSASISFRSKARLASGAASLVATGEDLLGEGKLAFALHAKLPKLSSVVSLLPATVASAVTAALDLSRAGLEVRLGGRGDLAKLKLEGSATGPGGDSSIAGEVDGLLPFRRAALSVSTRMARQEELLAMLPAHVRAVADSLKLQTDLRLGLNLGLEPGRAVVEQTFDLAAAKGVFTTQGMDFPIDLSGTRGTLKVTLVPDRRPVVEADLSGLRLRTVVQKVPLSVTSQGMFHLDTTMARTDGFALAVEGDPIRVDVTVQDPWHERRSKLAVLVDRWRLGRWAERFIPRERSIVVTGTASAGLEVSGRPPFVNPTAWVELAGVVVDAPELRGLGAGLPLVKARLTLDDILVDKLEVQFGVRRFHLPLSGSMKALLGVSNVYKADPKKAGPIILERLGGMDGMKQLLGEKQLERLIIDQTVKCLVWLEARDYRGVFLFKNMMPPEDKTLFATNPRAAVDKHIELAKQALADKMGFPKRTYGDKNYRMILITSVKARVLDEQLNSIWPEFIPFWRLTTTPSDW
jgi:hypothetical protein